MQLFNFQRAQKKIEMETLNFFFTLKRKLTIVQFKTIYPNIPPLFFSLCLEFYFFCNLYFSSASSIFIIYIIAPITCHGEADQG